MDCTALAEHLWLIITIQFQIKSMIAFLRSVVKQDKIRHGGSEAVQQGTTRIGATSNVTFCTKNCKQFVHELVFSNYYYFVTNSLLM